MYYFIPLQTDSLYYFRPVITTCTHLMLYYLSSRVIFISYIYSRGLAHAPLFHLFSAISSSSFQLAHAFTISPTIQLLPIRATSMCPLPKHLTSLILTLTSLTPLHLHCMCIIHPSPSSPVFHHPVQS
jgi:hypothetical protein